MAQYACNYCKKTLDLASAREVLKYGESEAKTKTLVIHCPHCGKENAYTVPIK